MRQQLPTALIAFVMFVTTVAAATAVIWAQGAPLQASGPVDPIPRIVEAFRTHNVVALNDPHGNRQVQAFILSLIRDPRFPDFVDDIVLESASSRYQGAIDRFVRGDDVPPALLRKAWEDHTAANSLSSQAAELIEAVRAVNGSLRGTRKLRVIAGDPPVDWENISSTEDHWRWIELRDSYPADLIRRQVVERERRALVLYGQGHLQRRQVASNYDMSTWQAQTVVSLLERDAAVRVFNIWTWLDPEVDLKESASWPVPSLLVLRGTILGQRDFESYARGLLGGARFAVKDGQLVALPRDQWRTLRMDEQFDALLYLGLPSAMTFIDAPRARCSDQQFVTERLRRLALTGRPSEVESFKRHCGV